MKTRCCEGRDWVALFVRFFLRPWPIRGKCGAITHTIHTWQHHICITTVARSNSRNTVRSSELARTEGVTVRVWRVGLGAGVSPTGCMAYPIGFPAATKRHTDLRRDDSERQHDTGHRTNGNRDTHSHRQASNPQAQRPRQSALRAPHPFPAAHLSSVEIVICPRTAARVRVSVITPPCHQNVINMKGVGNNELAVSPHSRAHRSAL